MKVGYDNPVFAPVKDEESPTTEDMDIAEEKALMARLEEVRKRRAVK
jgi:hypothetical protein